MRLLLEARDMAVQLKNTAWEAKIVELMGMYSTLCTTYRNAQNVLGKPLTSIWLRATSATIALPWWTIMSTDFTMMWQDNSQLR